MAGCLGSARMVRLEALTEQVDAEGRQLPHVGCYLSPVVRLGKIGRD